jgi:hypothetical protein
MRNILGLIIISMASMSMIDLMVVRPNIIQASDVDKISKAKQYILDMVIRPETVRFHDDATKVNDNNTVTIKFTFQNGFGSIETRTMDIKIQ